MKYFTIETNVFIHYKFFTDIDWCKELDSDELTLVLPFSIYEELGEMKYSPKMSDKRKDKIRRIEKRLMIIYEGDVIVRKGVVLEMLDKINEDLVGANGFNISDKDGWHLTSIDEYEKQTSNEVVIVTADNPFVLRAKKMGLHTYKLGDEYEDREKDKKDMKIMELEANLKKYESQTPEYDVNLIEPSSPVNLVYNPNLLNYKSKIAQSIFRDNKRYEYIDKDKRNTYDVLFKGFNPLSMGDDEYYEKCLEFAG